MFIFLILNIPNINADRLLHLFSHQSFIWVVIPDTEESTYIFGKKPILCVTAADAF